MCQEHNGKALHLTTLKKCYLPSVFWLKVASKKTQIKSLEYVSLNMNYIAYFFVLGYISFVYLLSSACSHPVDLVIAMDASGSIDRVNYYIMQEFVRDLIYGMGVESGSRVGIATFSTNANIEFNLNTYDSTDAILNAMNFPYTGGR